MSLTSMALESFNVKLEDMILVNLVNESVSPRILSIEVRHVMDSVVRAEQSIDMLLMQMDELYYVDLPATDDFQLDEFGDKVIPRLMVGTEAYKEIATHYKAGGFRSALNHLRVKHSQFGFAVADMATKVQELADTDVDDIAVEFESNDTGNIRPQFAVMYTTWSQFHQMFLASSLISTEIFYIQEGVDSLLGIKDLVSA